MFFLRYSSEAKNNVKDTKSFTPEPHALNLRGQIAIPRTQNGDQMRHILGDQMALQVLKNNWCGCVARFPKPLPFL